MPTTLVQAPAALDYIRAMSPPCTAKPAPPGAPPGRGTVRRDRRTLTRRRLLALLVGTAAASRGSSGADVAPRPGEVGVGAILRDGPLRGLNGPSRRLRDFLGRPLIINVWASWCGPCRQEMASLERLAWRGDVPAFNIIGTSTDDDDAAARRLLASTNATLDQFIDSHLQWETMLGASRLPLTVLVDARGRVVDKIYGARQWDSPDAAKLIDKAFGGAHAAPPR